MPRTGSQPGDPPGQLFFSTRTNSGHLGRLHRSGRAVKLAAGIYVVGATLPIDTVTRHHLWKIIAHYWPGAVICDRSAFDGGTGQWVFVCHPEPRRKSDLHLPGVTVNCRVGPGPLPGDSRWMEVLYVASPARALIENAEEVGRPPRNRPPRAAGMKEVGDQIDAISSNRLRLENVFHVFDVIRGHFDSAATARVHTLLAAAGGTYGGDSIDSRRLAARVGGSPFDAARVDLFRGAVEELDSIAPIIRPDIDSPESRRWLPFYEAYFSNYIEGTRFSVEEAYDIAIESRVPSARPEDAHDVSATFRIVNNPELMREVPRDADDLLGILQDRHRRLMAARSEKMPGAFKQEMNYAGATAFVSPDKVEGTLRAGWDHLAEIVDPFHRAVMMMFLVSECHPFVDGNGRVARILANAELVASGQHRVIIANSYRNDYLAALTAATAGNGVTALVSVLDFARRWVSAVDWSDWDRCRADLDASNAFQDPATAEHSGRRLRIPGAP